MRGFCYIPSFIHLRIQKQGKQGKEKATLRNTQWHAKYPLNGNICRSSKGSIPQKLGTYLIPVVFLPDSKQWDSIEGSDGRFHLYQTSIPFSEMPLGFQIRVG